MVEEANSVVVDRPPPNVASISMAGSITALMNSAKVADYKICVAPFSGNCGQDWTVSSYFCGAT
jgi:hypothetical protein